MRAKLFATAALLIVAPVCGSYGATTYAYDSLGRLWVVTYDNGMQITYHYDAAGNRTQVVTQTGSGLPIQAGNLWIKAYGTQPVTADPRSTVSDPNYTTPPTFTITGVGTAQHGAASYTASSVRYTSAPNFTGSDSFTYTVADPLGQTSQGTIFVANLTANPPVANNVTTSTGENVAAVITPLTQDTDPLGYQLSLQSVSTPSHGSAAIGTGSNNTKITYTPNSGFSGADSFTYTINDGHGQTATATITVNVGTAPVAVADFIMTTTNTATTYDARDNDSDAVGNALSVTSTTTPSHGSVVIGSDDRLTYTPSTGFTGLDTFTYTLSDGHGMTATALDSICVGRTIAAVNDTVNFNMQVSYPWQPQVNFDPRSNDTLSCGSPSIVSFTQPTNATIVGSSPPVTSLTYIWPQQVNSSNPHAIGTSTFTYTIEDAYGNFSTATVTVNINVQYTNQ
jgi:YD repeat-containing protein